MVDNKYSDRVKLAIRYMCFSLGLPCTISMLKTEFSIGKEVVKIKSIEYMGEEPVILKDIGMQVYVPKFSFQLIASGDKNAKVEASGREDMFAKLFINWVLTICRLRGIPEFDTPTNMDAIQSELLSQYGIGRTYNSKSIEKVNDKTSFKIIDKTTKGVSEEDNIIRDIAKRVLKVESLEIQQDNDLDFHNIPVWNIKAALEEAYRAGKASK